VEEIRNRAIQLISGQERIEQVVKQGRWFCVWFGIAIFIAGVGVGMLIPFDVEIVHTPHHAINEKSGGI